MINAIFYWQICVFRVQFPTIKSAWDVKFPHRTGDTLMGDKEPWWEICIVEWFTCYTHVDVKLSHLSPNLGEAEVGHDPAAQHPSWETYTQVENLSP